MTLELLRKQYKLTQKQMADRLEISQPQLSKLETGTRKLPKEIQKKIRKLFGKDVGGFEWFDPEEFFRNETRENWEKCMVSLGVYEESEVTSRPLRCSWCGKAHEGEGCNPEDIVWK